MRASLGASRRSREDQLAWAWGFPARYLRPLILVALLGILAAGAGLAAPLVVMELWNLVLIGGELGPLPGLLGILFLLAVVGFGLTLLTAWLYTRISVRVLLRMRLELLRKLLTQPASFFTTQPAGDLHARLSGDISDLQSFIVDVPLAVLGHLVVLLGSVVIMAYLDWRLFLVAIVPIPVAIWAVHLARDRVTAASRAVRDTNGEISSVLVESLTGAAFLKAFALENRQARRFLDRNRALVPQVVHMQVLASIAGGVPELLLRLGSLVVLGLGATYLSEGSLSQGAGGLIAIGMYQQGLFRPSSSILGMIVRYQQARASMDRVFEVLDRVSEVPEAPGARALVTPEGELSFVGVDFAYPGTDQPVLHRIDLLIPAGSSCAVIGPTGAGKSTLLGLLLRSQDPTAGAVTVDGHDLRELRRASYLRHVGVVTQETFLLNDTLEANLLCVRPRASREQIEAALGIADLAGLVSRLPDGLQTVVGERGARLSGGERQRVAIARAVLKDPRILVLDEATSALDWDTDRRIREALTTLMQGRTTVIVTHRVDTVVDVDQVVVLEAGRIVQRGAPRELRAVEGPFRSLLARAQGHAEGSGARAGGADPAGEPPRGGPPGAGARVAILDSGVVAGHAHVGAVAGGVCLTGGAAGEALEDRLGHGTPVAAVVRWGAPGAELYSVKVFDRDLVAPAARIAEGLRWSIREGMDVACLSLGARASDEGLADLREACREASAAGVIVVAAALGDEPSYPALWEEVIGVLRDERLEGFELAYRPGAPVALAASGRPRPIPGVPAGLNLSGPSFAAPRVAALAACLRAESPGLAPAEVRRRLVASATSPGKSGGAAPRAAALDVLVHGDGMGARLLCHVLAAQNLRAARVSAGSAWRPRTLALPATTIAELEFLGAPRGSFDAHRVPREREAPGRREDLWLVSESTVLEALAHSGVPAPTVLEAGDAERVQAPLRVNTDRLTHGSETWVEAARMRFDFARFAPAAPGPHPAHAFHQDGDRWLWAVEEDPDRTLLVTVATVLEDEDPEGPPPLDLGRLAEVARVLGAPVSGAALETSSLLASTGFDPGPYPVGVLPSGTAQGMVDPITSLGLRVGIRAAIRCGLACRALLEGRIDRDRVLHWYSRATPLDVAFLLAEVRWQYAPPDPGDCDLAQLGAALLPPWARALDADLAAALGRKLLTPYMMKAHAFLQTPLQARADPAEHPALHERAGRLEPTTRLGCPLTGLLPEEIAPLRPILAHFAYPTTPGTVLSAENPPSEQDIILPIIRLLEANLVGTVPA